MVKVVKKLVFKAYVLALMAFTLWYGYFMYPLIFGFEGKEAAAESLKAIGNARTKEEQMFVNLIAEQPQEKKRVDLGYRVIDQPYIKGHFHHIGFAIEPDASSPCIRCHGNAPHTESKKTRAFQNMHTFYLACETCHSQPAAGAAPWTFHWYDKKTGKAVSNPRAILKIEDSYRRERTRGQKFPAYGEYGAKISPETNAGGVATLLHDAKDMALANRYLQERERISPEEKKQRLGVAHQTVNKEAVRCQSCHRENDPYIPFASLGYPPTRLRELADNPVVSMVQKYDQFYIPNFLLPTDKGR